MVELLTFQLRVPQCPARPSSLSRPPRRRRITRRYLARAQRNQVATLVWIAPHLRTVLASHIALKLMDWRRLRSADDVERDGRMRVAVKTAHFKRAVAGIEGIAKRGR